MDDQAPFPSINLTRTPPESTTFGQLRPGDLFHLPPSFSRRAPDVLFMFPPQNPQTPDVIVILCVTDSHDHGPCMAYPLQGVNPEQAVMRVGRASYVRWGEASDA